VFLHAGGRADVRPPHGAEVRLAPVSRSRVVVALDAETGTVPVECHVQAYALGADDRALPGQAAVTVPVRGGRATLVGLPPGRWQFAAHHAQRTAYANRDVAATGETRVELVLAPPR
jgi:hypothetical protein